MKNNNELLGPKYPRKQSPKVLWHLRGEFRHRDRGIHSGRVGGR